ncbi:2-amino-4-hydroxy-6-hydroxymethyldihydropteridine pyrophosphokinase [bioreactor metagenome]|uniref:2-amino-4-hydroxy-6-hydroxymethyldihydropteridine diphosphokinase n=1 Tax=bioreactor metagenome TaxID=1076179 RepID=A0A644ZD01_9ZZZZ
MNSAYLSLGSNIEPEKNLPEALRRLSGIVKICGASSVWKTPSVGYDGPDFLNAVICVSTDLDAHSLKEDHLCRIEEEMGRVRVINKNAPRTIDLDILLFNDQVMDVLLFKFDHLLLPLSELVPNLREGLSSLPLNEIAAEHLKSSPATKIGKLIV